MRLILEKQYPTNCAHKAGNTLTPIDYVGDPESSLLEYGNVYQKV